MEPTHAPGNASAPWPVRRERTPAVDRALARRQVKGPEECWPWTGTVNADGYAGMAWVDGQNMLLHRLAYEVDVAMIPKGLTTDHLCRVRHCLNPKHLEAVTLAENHRRRRLDVRGALCRAGLHEFQPLKNGDRTCRQCRLAYMRRYREARRAERDAAAAAAPNP